MPLRKRKRGGPRAEKRRLYLIFDDWTWGYSIRALKLSPRSTAAGAEEQQLPRPFIRLEAPRGNPWHFAAVGTRIVFTHGRNQVSVPDGFMPIVDVRSRGTTFGPGEESLHIPIHVSVGSELFALDTNCFKMLSLEKLWPPRLEALCTPDFSEWSWCDLPKPPFHRLDVTSYVLHTDIKTIFFSTDEATFTFDTISREWGQISCWALPFTGHAHFVHSQSAFIGLSKDSPGHLCSFKLFNDHEPVSKVGKEKLFDEEDPGVFHVGATLVYLGDGLGTEFCLVQCVRTGDPTNDDDSLGEEDALMEGLSFERVRHNGCRYRLTTFSVAYDDNGVPTTAKTCLVKIYKVPEETTDAFTTGNPVAFWL